MDIKNASDWPRVAVMGAGAVGSYFGGMLARGGAPVTLVHRRAHVEAIARDGLFLDTIHFQERVAVGASTQPEAARDADLVLFSVKTLDTEAAARLLAPHLKPGAIVLSLQNGVDNIGRIRAAAGIEAVPAVVYVAVAMPAPGHVKHTGRGDLVIGGASRDALEFVATTFARAGVPCRISENIEGELWSKLVWNCAGNALTALTRATYGQVARNAATQQVLLAAANEVRDVARATGVQLPSPDTAAVRLKLAHDLGEATSSTAQDIARGKRTEIDALNGFVARRGAQLGVPTPVNHTLYALVKLLEENLPGNQ
ncbi:MAG TPA: 2-dehydropantoate 2-reductase [Candidatus Acidoferrales bacterium]|nr:2-dehydropantoate 2-reductase [Candidatus Acidoferrales bacterium]